MNKVVTNLIYSKVYTMSTRGGKSLLNKDLRELRNKKLSLKHRKIIGEIL